ncbi:hypothetical protein [Micromonospora sp. CPCC 206061]|uniref:hypothetical protein n=1 Tax=Micromonospora sp. CPCC 206061 TaxID=3122410 RepID=UPI002FEF0D67
MTKASPSRAWYAVAGMVTALGLAAAMAVLVTGVRSWNDALPDLGRPFGDGDTVPVKLRAGEMVILYVSPESAPASFMCGGKVAGSPIRTTEAKTFTFFRGFETWGARYELVADETGTAQLTCTAPAGLGAEKLAVGEVPDNGRLLRIMGRTFALTAGATVFSIAAGSVIVLVVWRRRRASARPAPAPA